MLNVPTVAAMDPYALPCHPEIRIDADDRDWRKIGVKGSDDVLRKETNCPVCKTTYQAYQRTYGDAGTVEWIRPKPFRVTAVPVPLDLPHLPWWQDDMDLPGAVGSVPEDREQALAAMQDATSEQDEWRRSTQLCTPVQTLTAQGHVFAEPGDLLLERFLPWNANNRRLALLWSPRLGRPVVAWHSFARLREA